MALYNWPDKISKPAEIPKLYGDGLIGCAFDQDDDDDSFGGGKGIRVGQMEPVPVTVPTGA